MTIMDNILDDKSFLQSYNPDRIARKIADNVRRRRLALNLTQLALSKKSGVSLGSLKRFENLGEISLKNLILLAICLDASEDFTGLFEVSSYSSVDEVIKAKKSIERKRGRKND